MRAFLVAIIYTLLVYGENSCEDEKDNVVDVYDIMGEGAKVRFTNVTIAVYGADKKPLCSKTGLLVQMPGYLRFASGQVEVVEPVTFKAGELRVQLTTEHSSFFIGQTCLNGEPANSFVPSSFCEGDFCEIIDVERCKLLNERQVMPVHQLYDDYLNLPDLGFSEIGGEWKAEVGLAVHGNEIARIRVGKSDEWIRVQVNELHGEL